MKPIPAPAQISSVTELTSRIKQLLEGTIQTSWVKGEVSNLRYQSSGHIYLTLKDSNAQISAVMFRGNAARMQLRLKEGMEVIALGNLSVYEPRGTYQFIIRECIEEGAGRLQAEFERLKQLLQTEGLFDRERKKTLPLLPRSVGIITSPTGAAIRDFLSILQRRQWTGRVVLFPAIVQGKEGAPDIVEKLRWAEAFGELDLIVLSRGGGSVEDLWNFNEEQVVRAVAACRIPTVSAVGHEIDFVLTDFAADQRAETPSAAAELISSGFLDIQQRLSQAFLALRRELVNATREKQQRFNNARDRLKGVTPARVLENRHLRIDELQERLRSRLHEGTRQRQHQMQMAAQRVKNLHPNRQLTLCRDQLQAMDSRLLREVNHRLQQHGQSLEWMEKRLQGLGVERVLKRGFALLRSPSGNILTQVSQLKHGQGISLQLHDGTRKAVVDTSEQLDLFSL